MPRFSVINKDDQQSIEVKQALINALIKTQWLLDEQNPDVVISVGGDGTFLRAIHHFIDQIERVVFVGIHTGTLGFLTNYAEDEIKQMIDDLNTQTYKIHPLPLLDIEVIDLDNTQHYYAVNEMRVENVIRTQVIKISVDHELLETFRGTGVGISTQVGSTAYNRSLGGSILYEGLDFLQLTEITGIHHRSFRSLGSPLILPTKSVVSLKSDDFCEAILCFDHLSLPLKKESLINIKYSNKKAQLIYRQDKTYIERLKSLF
jgi:NAD+ kinase